MNKSLGILMTALILGTAYCPETLAATPDDGVSRVRRVSLTSDADSSRVRRAQGEGDYGSPSAPYGSEAAAGSASSSDVKAAGTSSAGTEPSASNEAASSNGNASAGAYAPNPDIPLLQAPAGSGRKQIS